MGRDYKRLHSAASTARGLVQQRSGVRNSKGDRGVSERGPAREEKEAGEERRRQPAPKDGPQGAPVRSIKDRMRAACGPRRGNGARPRSIRLAELGRPTKSARSRNCRRPTTSLPPKADSAAVVPRPPPAVRIHPALQAADTLRRLLHGRVCPGPSRGNGQAGRNWVGCAR